MKTNNKQTAEFFVLGKQAHGSNFYTDGDTATSYTTTIAAKNNGIILLALNYRCCNWYGSFYGRTATTERQKHYIKQAANKYGFDWYEVPKPFAATRKEHENNWQYLQANAREMQNKANNARKADNTIKYGRIAARLLQEAENYWQAFCE